MNSCKATICECEDNTDKICRNCIDSNRDYIVKNLDGFLQDNQYSVTDNERINSIINMYKYVLTIPNFLRIHNDFRKKLYNKTNEFLEDPITKNNPELSQILENVVIFINDLDNKN
jgi:hypothetical protein